MRIVDDKARVIAYHDTELVIGLSVVVKDISLGERMTLILSPWKPKRSVNQNAYFHAICGEIARVTGMDRELVKQGLKEQYGARERWKDRLVAKPTHLMDKSEMAELIRGAEVEAGEAGVDLRGLTLLA